MDELRELISYLLTRFIEEGRIEIIEEDGKIKVRGKKDEGGNLCKIFYQKTEGKEHKRPGNFMLCGSGKEKR